jgi:cytochrome c oxidase assembly protein subunit 15
MKADGSGMEDPSLPHPSTRSVWPHRIAIILAGATFPLLFIGGVVTSKGAGLAVPDWPTTFGYNMFLYPWSKMVGNIFYEHSHRLVASFVGLLTIVLALVLWFSERRPWLRPLGFAALGLVIAQGILGGLRVVLLQPTLAIVHAAIAQAFFALTFSLAIFTSPDWARSSAATPMTPPNDNGRLRRLCAVTTALIYLQVVFGAVLRHTGERLDAHLAFAALVTLHVILVLMRAARAHVAFTGLTRPALALFALLLIQLALGGLSYLAKFTSMMRLPLDAVVVLTTSHLAVGALMLATGVVLTLRSHRLAAAPMFASRTKILTEQFSV